MVVANDNLGLIQKGAKQKYTNKNGFPVRDEKYG